MAVSDRAGMVDTDSTSVALIDTHTRRLACVDVAELYLAASVGIDTSSAHGSVASLDDTVADTGVAYHIHTSAVGGVLTDLRVAGGSSTAGDHTSVQRSGLRQRLIVTRCGIVDALCIFTVRCEPYHVERTGRESGVIFASDGIEHKRRRCRGVVT